MNPNLGRLGGQLGVMLCLLGFLVLFFGWNGAAGNDYVPAQFPYLISGGLVGVSVVVIGATLVLVQNQRTDVARLEALLERMAATLERQAAQQADPTSLEGYVVAGSSTYHRPECALPEARDDAHLVPLADVQRSTLEPCRVCRPARFGRLGSATPV